MTKATNPEKLYCPHCEGIELRRNGRAGFWQRQIMSRLGYFPWECGQCRLIYMLQRRSIGYRPNTGQGLRAKLTDRLLLKDQS
jgi:hypothetical protein